MYVRRSVTLMAYDIGTDVPKTASYNNRKLIHEEEKATRDKHLTTVLAMQEPSTINKDVHRRKSVVILVQKCH